jgi:hypothetical protein
MKTIRIILLLLILLSGSKVQATLVPLETGEKNLAWHRCGEQLTDVKNYNWWYGCSPTSAGMILTHYDKNGFGALIPGEAELNTFPSTPGIWEYNAQGVIASEGHVYDFYQGGDGATLDDLTQPWHSFDCLADFMGTSQDINSNPNGATTFWYYTDNSPLTEQELINIGYSESSGMCGIGEYLEYKGYDAAMLYNQYIFGHNGIDKGFSFEQYKGEILAGRPVMIHIEGHSMVGYGYQEGTSIIDVFDTWSPNGQNPGALLWGGDYNGRQHYGVTVMQPIPEPSTILLLGSGIFLSYTIGRGKRN